MKLTPGAVGNYKIPRLFFLILGVSGYLFLFFLNIYHRQPPHFDEILFIPNVDLFEKYGLSKEFLLKMNEQAPGPLYQFIHTPLKPLTHMEAPGIRMVNVVILALIILLISQAIVLLKKVSFREAFTYSLCIMAVPMIWQVTGLALTEIPGMLFATLSVLLLIMAVKWEAGAPVKSTLTALLAGISLGLAVLGRAPFLVLILASGIFLLHHFTDIRRWRTILIYAICPLCMSIPVFLIWGGMVPPAQAYVEDGGLNLWHGTMAFAYGAMFSFIIAPKWFIFNRRILLYTVITYFVLLVLNIYVLQYVYYPLSEALEKIFPPGFMDIYPWVISPFLGTIAIYFVACCCYRAWQHRENQAFLFILAAGMLILASSFKLTHLFSTRYVAQAAPFFVLILFGFDKLSAGRAFRFALGMAIGFLSLETYFGFQ